MCKVLVISHSQDIARNIELVDLQKMPKRRMPAIVRCFQVIHLTI